MPHIFTIGSDTPGAIHPAQLLQELRDVGVPVNRIGAYGPCDEYGRITSGTQTIYHSDGDADDFTGSEILTIDAVLASHTAGTTIPTPRLADLDQFAPAPAAGQTILVADADSGNPAICVYDGTRWEVIQHNNAGVIPAVVTPPDPAPAVIDES